MQVMQFFLELQQKVCNSHFDGLYTPQSKSEAKLQELCHCPNTFSVLCSAVAAQLFISRLSRESLHVRGKNVS